DDDRADAVDAVGGHEHAQRAHVLAAEPLRGDHQLHAIAGHEVDVDDAGGFVPRHLEPAGWIARHRLPQVARTGALANAGVYSVVHRATDPMHVLADLEEDHGDAAVLTHRDAIDRGHFVVAHDLLERSSSKRRRLAC